jgi:hypothetical protein
MVIGPLALRRFGGLGAWVGALALSLSVFSLTVWLAAYSDVSPLVGYFAGFALVVACVLSVTISTPSARRSCGALALLGLFALGVAQRLHGVAAAAWVLVALLAFGSALGAWVGEGIEQPGHLVFVALVSSLADAFCVSHPQGPTALLAQNPEALALLALPWPMLGTRDIVPFLGVGDVVFSSLYYAAARKHGLSLARTLVALIGAFVATAIAVAVLARPVAVLPFLGAAVLVAHPSFRRPPARDLRRGVWLITAFVFALAAWVFRRWL